MDTTFRSKSEPAPKAVVEEKEPNNVGAENEPSDKEPLEFRGDEIVLEALGIEESIRDLPDEEKENIKQVKSYVENVIEAKGLDKTVENFKETMESIKQEFGIPAKASADMVLDRIGGIVRAYRSLSFMPTDERKEAFIKLAGMEDSKKMNKYVYEIMEDYKIWQQ